MERIPDVNCDILRNMKILLRDMRIQMRMSQERVAELTGVSQSAVSRIEREEVSPSADELEMLAKGLNIKIFDLLESDYL